MNAAYEFCDSVKFEMVSDPSQFLEWRDDCVPFVASPTLRNIVLNIWLSCFVVVSSTRR